MPGTNDMTAGPPRTPPSKTPSLKEDSPRRSSLDEEEMKVIPVVFLSGLEPAVDRRLAQQAVLKQHRQELGVYDYAELAPSTRLLWNNTLQMIVRKLGTGITATVYLVKILIGPTDLPRFTAVKVTCAAFSTDLAKAELGFLNRIRLANRAHPGYDHVAGLLSSFTIKSPFGFHTCMVIPLLAQPLDKAMASSLPLSLKKKVIAEIILGLAYLHDECGIIHTDLTLGNVLVKIPEHIPAPDMLLTKEAWIEIATALDPAQYVMAVDARVNNDTVRIPITGDQPLQVPSLEAISISIVDFSSAYWTTDLHHDIIQNDVTRAPEVMLGRNWNSSVDIWSLGHLAFQLLSGMDATPMPSAEGVPFDDNYRLASLRALLGDYPEDFLQECPRSNEFFNEHGRLLYQPLINARTLEERLETIFPESAAEQALCAAWLRQLLEIQPAHRAKARNLLGHAWLRGAIKSELSFEHPAGDSEAGAVST
ncbi:kinase-like protein [Calocera viscosa TUFC12733]|uniref:non-specific serine/threonine protein kinase n=1 Tax=Calocera viscosa (strain TUFC12733) TaxID=1330018 RepID=A0A167FZ48_CALVF|nr:kinase-like protein [Calocera viscosa TUFC12733]